MAYYDQDEAPEVVEFPLRTHVATKQFSCVECLTPIKPGQRYEVRPLRVDGQMVSEKMHYLTKECIFERDEDEYSSEDFNREGQPEFNGAFG
jgi:hypothetical protein